MITLVWFYDTQSKSALKKCLRRHLIWRLFLVSFTAERCIRASPDQDFTNGFFVALFVRNDNETVMDHKATESDGLLPGGKRKRSQADSTQPVNDDVDNDSDSAHSSAHVSLLPKKKYRKKNKKHQEVNLQEQSKNMNLERNFGRDGGKKKRKRKKKNKKVSVCS